MLEGLDASAWGELEHGYGPADDLPDVLRAAASTDEQQAKSAVDELFVTVFESGAVFSASVAVVPFVAELAATPAVHHRSLLVSLLGAMADPHQAFGVEPAAVRAAVTAQVPRLLPLLSDPDPLVREAVAWTLARCRAWPPRSWRGYVDAWRWRTSRWYGRRCWRQLAAWTLLAAPTGSRRSCAMGTPPSAPPPRW
jgi:hypothetical protein